MVADCFLGDGWLVISIFKRVMGWCGVEVESQQVLGQRGVGHGFWQGWVREMSWEKRSIV